MRRSGCAPPGEMTLIDTLLTEQQLTEARLQLVEARRVYASAVARFKRETGTLPRRRRLRRRAARSRRHRFGPVASLAARSLPRPPCNPAGRRHAAPAREGVVVSEGLFRKAAIDKVSSPEQLDLLMRVTSPSGWLALLTMSPIVAVVGVWAVVGSIADLVDANGTLFRGERLYEVKATMSGSIVTLCRPAGRHRDRRARSIASLKRERAASEQRDADAVTIEKNRAMAARLRGQLGTLQRQWQLQKQLVDQGIKAPRDLLNIEREMDGDPRPDRLASRPR